MTTINAVNTTLSGQSGTGAFAGTISPSFVSPTLGVSSATSINFGGTSLANYQEGTWTPAYVGSGGGSATYSTQVGSYTRIGNRVFFESDLILTGSTLSGNITISGLPFLPAILAAASIVCEGFTATATTAIQVLINTSGSTLGIYVFSAGTTTPLTGTQLSTTSQTFISGCYHV
jgi:hypothetical protein